MKGMNGYGYQWSVSPGCSAAFQIAAGDVNCCERSSCWFWLLTAVVLGAALLAPKKR